MIHVQAVRHGNASIVLAGKQTELLEKLLSSDEGEEVLGGRGSIRIFQLSTGRVVKRHFLHGGMLRKVLGDLFAGSSRSLSEFFLTLKAHQRGAPVPRVLASITKRYFTLFYRSDIVTEMLPSITLGEALDRDAMEDLRPLLKLLLALHKSGVEHVDLNINNILIPNDASAWIVIDLDRGRLHKVLPVKKRLESLLRLDRSYQKKYGMEGPISFIRRYRIWHHYLVQSGLNPCDYKSVLRCEKFKRQWHQLLWK